MQKIVIFGIGKYYKTHKNELTGVLGNDKVVAFIDNRAGEVRVFDGKHVYLPTEIHSLVYDKILLMSIHSREMKEQLLGLGIQEQNIEFGWKYICEKSHGKMHLYVANGSPLKGEKILIISYDLGYNGGTLAVVYAASSLRALGYDVCIAARAADERLVKEILLKGVRVMVCPAIPCLGNAELCWMMQFDIIIINVFQMIRVAYELSKYKPVLWWLHESSSKHSNIYPQYRQWFAECDNTQWMSRLQIYAVSEIAKKNFEEYYPNMVNGILPYGIPDEHGLYQQAEKPLHKKIIFAIIGGISKLKAQDVFLKAAQNLMKSYSGQAEFWLIGSCGSSSYAKEIQQIVNDFPAAKCFGELPRHELGKLYRDIDVVVCASLEETMSMTITEGMMHEKACITTDATGMAAYIKDGENGIICKAGSVESLCNKMEYVLNNKEQCKVIGANARKTYESSFSMEKMGERLEKELRNTKQLYAHKQS